MNGKRWIALVMTSVGCLCATHAHAHFKQLSPKSWLTEDSLGSPQKGSPCGPGNTRPFIGDDVQPIPASNAVTRFHAGETITVKWQETVYHPGYFRIALAQTSAAEATSTELPNPALTDPDNCHYDVAAVKTSPHGNVLADGLFMAHDQNGSNRSLMQKVTLPNKPCDHCALQIVQVMEGHPAASCFYFHCADIQILPAAGGERDAGDAADASNATAGSGGGSAATSASSPKSGGCSVVRAAASSSAVTAWSLLAVAAVFVERRRSRPTGEN